MLKPLANIKLPNLINFDRQNIIEEIIENIKLDPDWNNIYDGDLYQNASQMIINLFAFLFEKNITAINKQLKENYINKAVSEESIYENLKQNKINIQQNREAFVNLIGILNNNILRTPLIIPKFTKLYAQDLNSQMITFELISKVNNKYDYLNDIVIFPSIYLRDSFYINAYSGETFQIIIPINDRTFENFNINIPNENIIQDSIRIYYQTEYNTHIELLETDSFVVAPTILQPIFPNGIPHYIISYKQNGSADIIFGSNDFGNSFNETHIGGNIVIYGRVGGGKSNNIINGILNQTLTFNYSGTTLDITFNNVTPGVGGADRENSYVAQYIAPLRYGRGKAIVDELDAKSSLYQSVVKHKIETPEYSEIFSNIPLLHAYHWIAPIRDFNNFVFPEVELTDTLQSYTEKFLLSINNFLNVYGTNDGEIEDEEITKFFYPNLEGLYQYLYDIQNSNILSGTLTVQAYNNIGLQIDKITFDGNYYNLNDIISTAPNEPATLKTNYFNSINIFNNISQGQNNIFRFRLNNDQSYIFNLQLPLGIRTPLELADALQSLIQAKITTDPAASAYQPYINYRFFSYEQNPNNNNTQGRIIFRSFDVGINSTIELLNPQTITTDPQLKLLTLLGLREKIYRPENSTGKVFEPLQNVYHYNTGELLLNINAAQMIATKTFTKDSSWNQNSGINVGPLLSLVLKDNDDNTILSNPHINNTITINALNTYGTIIDSLSVLNVQELDKNIITTNIQTSGLFFKDINDNNFNYDESKLELRLADPILATQYILSFPQIVQIKLYRLNLSNEKIYPEIETFFETDGSWHQNIFNITGPTINLTLATYLIENESYQLEFYAQINGILTPIGFIDFYNIDINNTNEADNSYYEPTLAPSGILLVPPFSNSIYDPEDKTIMLQCIDGTINTEAQPYYNQGYDNTVTEIKVLYKEKTYESIKISYLQNPYKPTNEALQLKNILIAKNKRMICLENIFKKIRFIPIGIDMILSINNNFSLGSALDKVLSIIIDNFKYNNINYMHTIGSQITGPIISNIINQNAQGYGIENITFNTNFNIINNIDSELLAQSYFFVLDDIILDQLKTLEEENSNIEGIYNMFALKILPVKS